MNLGFQGKFQGVPVLVTGHTGFKGSWLSTWLHELGAQVIGYSQPPPTHPSLFDLTQISKSMTHIIGDIRDYPKLRYTMTKYQPKVIFHLAAQPLVLSGFDQPKETFDINAGGTINILEAARFCPSVKAIVVVSTDKCYENNEWMWGYRENDRLGGSDPYSASKAMVELATASYRKSFFSREPCAAVATARAGNVIGGGDFSENRLIPDAMKALMDRQKIEIRNPKSIRPWLYVLEAISAYLHLAVQLMDRGQEFADAWNFGPLVNEQVTTQALVEKAIEMWGTGECASNSQNSLADIKPEKGILRLNWEKAAQQLKWQPVYTWIDALEETIKWYRAYSRKSSDLHQLCIQQIHDYTKHAEKSGLHWMRQETSPTLNLNGNINALYSHKS